MGEPLLTMEERGAIVNSQTEPESTPSISPPTAMCTICEGREGREGSAGNEGDVGNEGKVGNAGREGSAGREGNAGREGSAGREGNEGNEGSERSECSSVDCMQSGKEVPFAPDADADVCLFLALTCSAAYAKVNDMLRSGLSASGECVGRCWGGQLRGMHATGPYRP